MLLDTTHNAWHGPYSMFGNWRKWLANKCGFNLLDMVGFGGDTEWTPELMEHPLYPLLNHSDCDGELSVDECKSVRLGLDQKISEYNKSKDETDYYMIERCIEFRDGCLLAIKQNKSIEFH